MQRTYRGIAGGEVMKSQENPRMQRTFRGFAGGGKRSKWARSPYGVSARDENRRWKPEENQVSTALLHSFVQISRLHHCGLPLPPASLRPSHGACVIAAFPCRPRHCGLHLLPRDRLLCVLSDVLRCQTEVCKKIIRVSGMSEDIVHADSLQRDESLICKDL